MTRDFEAEKNKLLTEVIELRKARDGARFIINNSMIFLPENGITILNARKWLEQNGKGEGK